ncbi:L,D-transpeptidase family protein [Corallococcus sp. EGB]|uniref:L,D-transpeptidase family protein n=1 Tax=Corallococcus sp. EGB TaxID=1521117 RepID=UPI001CBE8691|nr:L,D-transpeptidase family protein [Corallococcus sp. EGB]
MLASALHRESPLRPAESPDTREPAPVLSVLPRGVERPGDRTGASGGNSLTRFSGPAPSSLAGGTSPRALALAPPSDGVSGPEEHARDGVTGTAVAAGTAAVTTPRATGGSEAAATAPGASTRPVDTVGTATVPVASGPLVRARVPAASVLEHPRFTGSPQLADVASGATVLGTGAKGDGLRAVQGALLDMGFALYGGADGRYGPDTARALRNFQVHAGLRSSGVLDAATLKALEALAPAAGSRGQSRALPSPFYSGQPVRVVIALREHRTFLFDPEGKLVDIFPNAAGTTATPTHPGLKVVRAKLDQVATEDAGARLWNDRHVFGARLLDLSWADGRRSGEELHGTSAPALLGGDVSHG